MSKILDAAAEYVSKPHHGADMETTHDGAFLAGTEFARGWVLGLVEVWEAHTRALTDWMDRTEDLEAVALVAREIEVWTKVTAALRKELD